MPRRVNTRENIISHIDTSDADGCHVWTGACNWKGYGRTSIHGKMFSVHRLVWEWANGPIPQGMVIAHHCDTPRCCRLDHLFLTTPAGNMADRDAKGRTARGDRSGARLHPERLRRGDNHPHRLRPEIRCYGDQNGARLHPERLARGDRHGSRTKPERIVRGEQVGISKLTAQTVVGIRQRYAAGGVTYTALAQDYGVSRGTIARCVARSTWKHVV